MNLIRISWVVFGIFSIASIYAVSLAPEGMQLPIHWNLFGEADNFMQAKWALLLMPATILGILLLFAGLKLIEPRKDNLQKSETARRWIMFAVVVLLTIMGANNIALVAGYEFDIFRLTIVMVMLLLVIIGNFLPKLRSNFFIGIKTPWTLSSEENWKKTHYFGGRIFMIFGALGLLGSLLVNTEYMAAATGIPVAIVIVAPIFYSWYIWRQEKA